MDNLESQSLLMNNAQHQLPQMDGHTEENLGSENIVNHYDIMKFKLGQNVMYNGVHMTVTGWSTVEKTEINDTYTYQYILNNSGKFVLETEISTVS